MGLFTRPGGRRPAAGDRNTWTCAQCGQVRGAGGRRPAVAGDRNFPGIIGLLICAAPGDMAGTTAEARPGEALTAEPSVHKPRWLDGGQTGPVVTFSAVWRRL